MERLSGAQNAFLGAVAGAIEVSINQPMLYAKNASQQRLPFTLNPMILYRGLAASIGNVAVLTAIQFYGAGLLRTYFHNQNLRKLEQKQLEQNTKLHINIIKQQSIREQEDDISDIIVDQSISTMSSSLTTSQKLASALFGGILSGIACGPMELIMIQQQRKGLPLIETIINIYTKYGITKGFLRGITMSCGREGIFTAGYLGLAPLTEEWVHSVLHDSYAINSKNNPYLGQLLAAFMTGAVASITTHPMDTVKTCVQGDIERKEYKSILQTFKKLSNEKNKKVQIRTTHNTIGGSQGIGVMMTNKLFGFDKINSIGTIGGVNMKRLYTGFGWRYLRMAMSFFIILRSKEILAPILYPTII